MSDEQRLPPGPQPVSIGGLSRVAAPSRYDALGGHPTFERLVSSFYARVSVDPVLTRIYPPDDWAGAARRLMLFLEEYFGGPATYTAERGHPRLRRRHARFRIDREARDAWLGHMRAALDDLGLPPTADAEIWDYLQAAADLLVNTPS